MRPEEREVPRTSADVLSPPYPAPPLPAPGGRFIDPTFGTPQVRVTKGGGQVNDSAAVGMFSADSRLFYVRDATGAFVFYRAIRRRGALRTVKLVGGPIHPYGFPVWDPVKPRRLYTLGMREVWRHDFTIRGGQMRWAPPVLEVDFREVPNTPTPPYEQGYPYGLFFVSPAAIAVTVSTTDGQETFDRLVLYDRGTKRVRVLDLRERIGWGAEYDGTHGTIWDAAGSTAVMGLNPQRPGAFTFQIAYDRATDTFSPRWALNRDGYRGPGGHLVVGEGWVIGDRYAGGGWSWLDPQTQRVVDPVCAFPTKNGRVCWWWDQHSSHLGPRGFIASFYTYPIDVFTWTPPEGGPGPWRLEGYTTTQWGELNPPEELRYKGLRVARVAEIPVEPGGWFYDVASDTLHFWPPDDDDPRGGKTAVFDWFPLQDEIVRFVPDPGGDVTKPWTFERLLHHRCHNNGSFYEIPKGNLSPDGTLLLYATNGDGMLLTTDVVLASLVERA